MRTTVIDASETWCDARVVGQLLGVDADGARAALEALGGIEGLARAGVGSLCQVPGVGPARALRVRAAFELATRARRRRLRRPRAKTPAEVAALVGVDAEHLDVEHMWVVVLDGASRVRAVRRIAQGGRHGLVVSSREIYAVALREGATAIVLAHNHPSGDPRPSAEDVAMTRVVAAAGRVVGVPLVDHVVVVSPRRYVSLLEEGLLEAAVKASPSSAAGGPGGPRVTSA